MKELVGEGMGQHLKNGGWVLTLGELAPGAVRRLSRVASPADARRECRQRYWVRSQAMKCST
ncbi:MAG: hypothetical protein R3F44_14720 [Candidatus Competibacteraceae bacterium]